MMASSWSETCDGRASANPARQAGTATHSGAEAASNRHRGYSHGVRSVCRERVLQWVPVGPGRFTGLFAALLLLYATLMGLHYAIYVSGAVPWYGAPLAVLLDISHPQGIAHWVELAMWNGCLGTAVFVYRIRRHKLDDYRGEYRIWLPVCAALALISLNASTHWVELVGQTIDPWTRAETGWSGRAMVMATLVTLYGVTVLRLCTELKSVPLSLLMWLASAAAVFASMALAQEEFRVDLSIQARVWLRHALWHCGQLFLWCSLLGFLRHHLLHAQRRFQSLNNVPLGARWTAPWRRTPAPSEPIRPAERTSRQSAASRKPPATATPETDASDQRENSRRWLRWLRPARVPDDAPEFRKQQRRGNDENAPDSPQPRAPSATKDDGTEQDSRKSLPTTNSQNENSGKNSTQQTGGLGLQLRTVTGKAAGAAARAVRWRPRFSKLTGWRIPRPQLRLRLPRLKLSLPGLRLRPPAKEHGSSDEGSPALRKVTSTGGKPMPSTANSPQSSELGSQAKAPLSDEELLAGNHGRRLTKSERKRLKRLQQQHHRAA